MRPQKSFTRMLDISCKMEGRCIHIQVVSLKGRSITEHRRVMTVPQARAGDKEKNCQNAK